MNDERARAAGGFLMPRRPGPSGPAPPAGPFARVPQVGYSSDAQRSAAKRSPVRLRLRLLSVARGSGQAQRSISGKVPITMKLYVGNLPFSAGQQELMDLFSQYGEVASASVVMDRETGRSRGFGFVEMNDDSEARAAIEGASGATLDGRQIVVNEAKPRPAGGGGGGGGGGGWGGGGGGRGGGGGGRGGGGGGGRGRY